MLVASKACWAQQGIPSGVGRGVSGRGREGEPNTGFRRQRSLSAMELDLFLQSKSRRKDGILQLQRDDISAVRVFWLDFRLDLRGWVHSFFTNEDLDIRLALPGEFRTRSPQQVLCR
jgi:hypothetical protein